jgi:hypothetical protein
MSVRVAVERELARLAERDADLAGSTLAFSALALADGLESDASLAMKAMAAKELRETMDRLFALAPAVEKGDFVDELRDRRAARRGEGVAAAEG